MPWGFGSSSSKNKELAINGTTGASPSSGQLNLKKNLKVLVVDDIRVNRMVLTALLRSLGVQSQEVENGKEAVDLHLAGIIFDLILIDMEMPVMDGPTATRILRSMGITTKMVGVSGNCRSRDKQEFMSAGLDEFVVKPMTRTKLIALLQEVDEL